MRHTRTDIKIQSGFTLIELLVVIAIIGLLAGAILLNLGSARSKSRDAKRLADIKQMASSLELYFAECNAYPVVTTPLTLDDAQGLYAGTVTTCGNNQGTSGNGGFGASTGTTFLTKLPKAPTPIDGSCATAGAGSSNANPYIYTSYTDSSAQSASGSSDTFAASYKITFCLGSATGVYGAGLRTLTPAGVQ